MEDVCKENEKTTPLSYNIPKWFKLAQEPSLTVME
jgi:hypothetical protein